MARTGAVLWTLLILAACSIPGANLTSTSFWEADKLFHFSAFLVFAVLWYFGVSGGLKRRLLVTAGLGLAYSLLTEAYQGVMPIGRTMDILDVVANLLGVLCGLMVVVVGVHIRKAQLPRR